VIEGKSAAGIKVDAFHYLKHEEMYNIHSKECITPISNSTKQFPAYDLSQHFFVKACIL
jgi:hypothetical protein